MKLLAFLLAFMHIPGQQDPQTPPLDPNLQAYQNLTLGLKINFPKAWEITTNKKFESRILIPIPNSSDRGVVEIIPVNFRGRVEDWQIQQAAMAKSSNRAVDRQWDEEILGVPLLMTKVTYTERGSTKTSEIGLLYTLGFNKLMYRITAAPEQFDNVDSAWRQSLQSLRTWDNSLPKVEDPSIKIERTDVPKGGGLFGPDELPHPTIPHEVNKKPTGPKPEKSPVGATINFNGRKVELRIPADWKVDSNKDGTFTLRHAGVSGPVNVSLYPVEGTDPVGVALLKASGASLNDFDKVTSRDESLPKPNKAGVDVGVIWRTGTGAKSDLCTCEASCQSSTYYLILTYRSNNAGTWKGERQAIEELLDHMSIEPGK
jgi:hypothetical protein